MFYSCLNLTNLILPSTITSIEDGAFYECIALTSFVFPNKITIINGAVFSDCSGLISVTLPDGLTKIDNYAFSNASSLSSIIYKGVTYTSKSAFLTAMQDNGIQVVRPVDFDSTALQP